MQSMMETTEHRLEQQWMKLDQARVNAHIFGVGMH